MDLRQLMGLLIIGVAIFLVAPDKQQNAAVVPEANSQNQGQPIAPTAFEKSLIETLGTIANQQRAAYEQARADQKPWWIDYALLAVGVVYTVFAGLQWWAIRRQAKIAADNVIATKDLANLERPWLFAIRREKAPDFGWPLVNRESNFRIVWDATNFGKSPAFVTFLFSKVAVLDYPIRGELPEPADSEINQMVIAPGEKYLRAAKRNILANEVADIKNGKKCIVFYGMIKYESRLIGAKPHHSKFCEYWFYEDERPEEPEIGPKGWVDYT